MEKTLKFIRPLFKKYIIISLMIIIGISCIYLISENMFKYFRKGQLNLLFNGICPKSIIVNKGKELPGKVLKKIENNKDKSFLIRPLDYGSYIINIKYSDGKNCVVAFYHDNSWQTEQLTFIRNVNEILHVIHISNGKKVAEKFINLNEDVKITTLGWI